MASGIINAISGMPSGFNDYKAAEAYIVAQDHNGQEDKQVPRLAFQWFPETISITKETGWSRTKAVGLSHELEKWGGGTSRSLSFSAAFTNDEKLTDDATMPLGGVAVGPVAKRQRWSPDLRAAMRWLWYFQTPSYGHGGMVKHPAKLWLILEKTGIGPGGADYWNCTLDSCSIEIKAFWPDGTPRMISAQLSFTESIMKGSEIVNHDAVRDFAMKTLLPKYHITPRAGMSETFG